jgi:Spy/CpxP family protein refolding chaperone
MKTNTIRNAMICLITIGLMATGTVAFAGKGMDYRDDECVKGGYGYHRNIDCPYGRQAANLTDEQKKQLDAERQAFFNATKTQRQDLYAKHLELRAEMAKRTPDMKKASGLQKEISDLQANLDQKRLTHIMKMREINPDAGIGCFKCGQGMRGHGHGAGDGRSMGYYPGYCHY